MLAHAVRLLKPKQRAKAGSAERADDLEGYRRPTSQLDGLSTPSDRYGGRIVAISQGSARVIEGALC